MYGLHGKFRAHPGQRDALLNVLLDAAGRLRELDGCYFYVVSTAPDDPDGIWVTEIWRDQAAHQGSLAHPAIQALITAGRPLIAAMSDRSEFTPLGGKGLPAGTTL